MPDSSGACINAVRIQSEQSDKTGSPTMKAARGIQSAEAQDRNSGQLTPVPKRRREP